MTEFHLLSLPINLGPLRKWAALRGFGADEGCALHHLLSETFGKGVLQPFRLMVSPGAASGTLYAYMRPNEAALKQVVAETALPDALTVCDVAALAAKAMPQTWKVGRRVAFDLRVRPLKRLIKPVGVFPKGAEVDAFLVKSLRASPQVPPQGGRLDRAVVYLGWLRERLGEAAKLDQAQMVRYEQRTVLRGGRSQQGPDVVWHGELTVLDSEKFTARLIGGVGRHTAYGYGMLLLRPVR